MNHSFDGWADSYPIKSDSFVDGADAYVFTNIHKRLALKFNTISQVFNRIILDVDTSTFSFNIVDVNVLSGKTSVIGKVNISKDCIATIMVPKTQGTWLGGMIDSKILRSLFENTVIEFMISLRSGWRSVDTFSLNRDTKIDQWISDNPDDVGNVIAKLNSIFVLNLYDSYNICVSQNCVTGVHTCAGYKNDPEIHAFITNQGPRSNIKKDTQTPPLFVESYTVYDTIGLYDCLGNEISKESFMENFHKYADALAHNAISVGHCAAAPGTVISQAILTNIVAKLIQKTYNGVDTRIIHKYKLSNDM